MNQPLRALTTADSLDLDLPLNPVPQGRARIFFHHKKGTRSFTPDRTLQFYADFQMLARAAGIRRPLEGPLALEIHLWRQYVHARGDLSNMVKAIEDAGNGHLWVDDRQIVAITARLVKAGPKVKGRILLRARRPK